MEFTPRASELTTLLENRIIHFYTDLKVDEIGRVVSVGDGIARVYGLNEIQAGEMVEFASGVKGIALNLENESVGIVLIVGLIFFSVVGVWVLSKMDPTTGDEGQTLQGGASSSSENPEDEESRRRERKRKQTEQHALRELRALLVRYCYRYACNGKRSDVCGDYCPAGMSHPELDALVARLAEVGLGKKKVILWRTGTLYLGIANSARPPFLPMWRTTGGITY
jgi:hypothetical protein